MNIYEFWEAVLKQDADRMRTFFKNGAYVNWHCTNEHFTAEEYIRANCEYPGEWGGEIERLEQIDNLSITVVRVYTLDKKMSFHVVSFMKTEGDKIVSLDEYWGDDGEAPVWRQEKNIGRPLREKDC